MVGPNGSGKSNVIDAMLFVFGKRAKQVNFLSADYDALRVIFIIFFWLVGNQIWVHLLFSYGSWIFT